MIRRHSTQIKRRLTFTDERNQMNGRVRLPALACVFVLSIGWGVAPVAAQNGPTAVQPAETAGRKITPPSRPLRTGGKPGDSRNGSTGSFWKTIAMLGVIVAIILIGAKLLKKHVPKLTGGIPHDAMEMLGKRDIDRGQRIYLVRLGSRILVIGSSQGGLQTLTEVTDSVEIDYLAGLCRSTGQNNSVSQGFLTLFNRTLFGSQEPAANGPPESPQHAEAEHLSDSESYSDGVSPPATPAESQRTHV